MKAIFSGTFFLFITITASTQQMLETDSGQKIQINSDGSFDVLDVLNELESSLLNPFELPKSRANTIELSDKRLTLNLLSMLQPKEATLAVKNHFLSIKTFLKSGEIEQARKMENTYLLDSFLIDLDLLNKEQIVIIESYASLSRDINDLKHISEVNDDLLRKEKLKHLSQKYEVDVDKYQSFEPNITTNSDITIDQRKPWEINDHCGEVQNTIVDNQVNRSTQTDLFFSHTPKRLGNYYRNEDFLSCNGGISKIDGKYYLDIKLRFRSKDAQKGYGRIDKNSFLRLELLSGNKVFLYALSTHIGELENYSGNTVYNVRYEFSNDFDLRLLKRNFVTNIGLLWSSGFEEYPIYKIDFLKEKLSCIDKEN